MGRTYWAMARNSWISTWRSIGLVYIEWLLPPTSFPGFRNRTVDRADKTLPLWTSHRVRPSANMKMKKKHTMVETENLIWKRRVRQALEGCSFITAKESFTEKEIFQGYVACGMRLLMEGRGFQMARRLCGKSEVRMGLCQEYHCI